MRLSASAWAHFCGCRGSTHRCTHPTDQTQSVELGQLVASEESRWQQLWTIINLLWIWTSARWLKGWVLIPWTSKCARNLIWGYCNWEDSRQSFVIHPLTPKWTIAWKPYFWGAPNGHQKVDSCNFMATLEGSTILVALGRLGFHSAWGQDFILHEQIDKGLERTNWQSWPRFYAQWWLYSCLIWA